jgi:hypothetical protein
LEERLGVALPPSCRQFLQAGNGIARHDRLHQAAPAAVVAAGLYDAVPGNGADRETDAAASASTAGGSAIPGRRPGRITVALDDAESATVLVAAIPAGGTTPTEDGYNAAAWLGIDALVAGMIVASALRWLVSRHTGPEAV